MLAALLGALSLFAAAPAQAQTATLSIDATPECGSTVTDTSVQPTYALMLTPAPASETETEYRWVTGTTKGDWIGALPIRTSGRSDFVPRDNTFAQLRQAYPGFSGFEYRLTSDTSVTAACTWEFGSGAVRPEMNLWVAPNPVPEGSPVIVTLTLTAALSHDVVIPLTMRTRVSDRGDVGTLSSIRIRAGSTSGTGTITTARDADTLDESFTVALDVANLPPSVQAGHRTSADVTISERQHVRLRVSPESVPEGSPVTVTVSLTGPLPHDVDISLDLDPISSETSPPPDHGTLSSIRIRAGETTGTGTITTARDADTDDELFWLSLVTRNLPALGLTGSGTVLVTIIDDGGDGGTGAGGGGGGGGGASPGDTTSPDNGGSPPEEPSDTPCGESDREYLVSFYRATGGENWREKGNWNSTEPLDQWFGVKTDEDGEVVSLRLTDNGLSGDIPEELLLCLSELKELALWDNEDLSGEVPEELVLAVERAALREIAEMLDLNPEWFYDYEDPFNFEDWHEGVTTDDEGRVTELDLTGEGVIGEIPEILSEQLQKLREIMITTSSGGCAVGASSERMGASALLVAVLMLLAASRGFRARRD